MKFAVLLTCCVSPLYCKEDEIRKRKKLYLKVIKKWLKNTDLEIYCVDSSAYKFDEIKNSRFHIASFLHKNKDKNLGKTQGEIKSLLYAYKYFKKKWKDLGYTHVIKITGRYYLEDLEQWTIKTKNKDLWTQSYCMPFPQSWISYFLSYQNSEIFVCKISKLYEMFSKNKNILMERYLYDLEDCGKYKVGKLPKLKNTLKTKRGDNLVLEHL